MPQHPQRFWLAALVTAWAVDLLFWNKPIGISFLIFTLLSLALVSAWHLLKENTPPV
jgi:hypothetical protein